MKIKGIELKNDIGGQLGGAPEDAAKAFMRAASLGLANVLADAIKQAVGEAVGNVGGPPPDWTGLVRNVAVDLNWDTPPGTPLQTLNSFSLGSAAGNGGAIGGIDVSVGISAHF